MARYFVTLEDHRKEQHVGWGATFDDAIANALDNDERAIASRAARNNPVSYRVVEIQVER